ncbi:MAG: group 1 truncated hemoglobin [Verrucomicrobiota bacterium]
MESQTTLFDRIGGAETISSLVDSFYQKVLADTELSNYFKNASMDKLLAMQKEFFSAATGGPLTYSGRPLRDVHRHMTISKLEFGRFTEHLIDTLKEVGVAEDASYEIISHVNLYADEITDDVY